MEFKYNKSTDSEHTIKLDSTLIYAAWRTGFARGGQKVSFEVLTSFVGNGAKIKAKGKSTGGENLGTVSGQMKNNKFVGQFDIPDDIEMDDMVYFTVDLSGNGLSGESNRIPAAPPIIVSNMKWSAQEARRGDILKLTADVEGCSEETPAKITIYEYDQDKVHDKITELPAVIKKNKIEISWEYEYHEDTDEVPTEEELQRYGKSYNPPEYFFVIEIEEQKFGREQESKLLTFKDYIEIELKDPQGDPVADEKYKLILADGTEKEGTLNADGYARVEGVPPGQYTIEFPDIGFIDNTDKPTDGTTETQPTGGDDTQADDTDTQEDTTGGGGGGTQQTGGDDTQADDTDTQEDTTGGGGGGTQQTADDDTDTQEDSQW